MLRRWIWRDFANILLGTWLIAGPATLGYRDAAMVANDVATGILIVILGTLTLSPRFDLARWALCFSGIWLLLLQSSSGRAMRAHTRTTRWRARGRRRLVHALSRCGGGHADHDRAGRR
jgi:hypothetical protein